MAVTDGHDEIYKDTYKFLLLVCVTLKTIYPHIHIASLDGIISNKEPIKPQSITNKSFQATDSNQNINIALRIPIPLQNPSE